MSEASGAGSGPCATPIRQGAELQGADRRSGGGCHAGLSTSVIHQEGSGRDWLVNGVGLAFAGSGSGRRLTRESVEALTIEQGGVTRFAASGLGLDGAVCDILLGQGSSGTLHGGDDLTGGGRDTLSDGARADVFRFAALSNLGNGPSRYVVQDVQSGLDVSDTSAGDGLTFAGTAAITGSWQVRFNDARSCLQIEATGDGVAHVTIHVSGVAPIGAEDVPM